MGKSRRPAKEYDDYYDDEADHHREVSKHRKVINKRLTSAIRSRNVEDLINLSDEDDF